MRQNYGRLEEGRSVQQIVADRRPRLWRELVANAECQQVVVATKKETDF